MTDLYSMIVLIVALYILGWCTTVLIWSLIIFDVPPREIVWWIKSLFN